MIEERIDEFTWKICCSTDITDDVLGYLENDDVLDLLERIKNLWGEMMERPKLRYAYNEALINTYAEELEKYCDELEKISSTLSKSFSESMFKIYQLNKALDKACELLESATEDGLILCPCEYLGICHCESTESGYECNGDVDYKWKDALMKWRKNN